ncbi:hypothetical protein [Cyclonatronum proteinivorum]|nr:hypothetical protein [Cyclonatronum proteinivorum]
MKRLTWLVLGISISLIWTGCESDSSRTYTGTLLQLDYSGPGDISGGSWIEIDGIRFEHIDQHEALLNTPDALPATIVYQNVGSGGENGPAERGLPESFTRLDIAIQLGNFLRRQSGDDFQYINPSPTMTMLQGRLRIRRSDEQPITVRLSDGYPITVTVLE